MKNPGTIIVVSTAINTDMIDAIDSDHVSMLINLKFIKEEIMIIWYEDIRRTIP